MFLPATILLALAASGAQASRRNYGMGMNFGKGYPVVNPYFPGLGGGLDIFSGLNPNKEPESPYTPQAAKNCRMVKVTELEGKVIDDFKKCREIQGLSYNWLEKKMLNQGGMCRWAGGRESAVEEEGRGVCLCPATTEKLCTKGRASCYFHTDRKTNEKTCISKPERFYNQLARLLSKRGKKDFSMKIQYGGSGARGYLPMGLQGPSLIGRGNPYLGHHHRMHYGNFGPQGFGGFGFSPNYQYRTGQGFGGFGGHGPQGNYKASGPGAAAWGNPSSPFAPAFNRFAGYGGGFYGKPSFPSPINPTGASTPEGYGQQQSQYPEVQPKDMPRVAQPHGPGRRPSRTPTEPSSRADQSAPVGRTAGARGLDDVGNEMAGGRAGMEASDPLLGDPLQVAQQHAEAQRLGLEQLGVHIHHQLLEQVLLNR